MTNNSLSTQAAAQSPIVDFKRSLKRLHDAKELDMLPSSVSYTAFRNAAVVAMTDNPSILKTCNQESIFKAVRKLAAAGLLPDGREAAIVPYKGQATAMPMVYGLIKTARNSGQVVTIWADVVYENEELSVWIEEGERKFDHKMDPLVRSGGIKGVYAVAKLTDGTIEFEPMSKDEIEKRRMASATQKGDLPTGIWAQWYNEMAKKTAIRALCKRLPMSSEDMNRLMVEQDQTADPEGVRDVSPDEGAPTNGAADQTVSGTSASDLLAEKLTKYAAGAGAVGAIGAVDDAEIVSDAFDEGAWSTVCDEIRVHVENGATFEMIATQYEGQLEEAGEERVKALIGL